MRFVWDLDPVFITIPFINLSIRYYGFIFSVVFLLGFFLYRWQIKRGYGTDEEAVSFIIPGFLGVLVGARLGHVLFYNLDYLIEHPLWLFKVWQGGLSSHGATIGLILALLYQARKTKRTFLELGDRFSFSASIGAGLIRVANFMNSEIVGKIAPEDAYLSVSFPRYDLSLGPFAPYRYPTQFLEAFLGLFIFVVLLITDRLFGAERRPRGLLSAVFLTLYFLGRFLIEFLKERQTEADNLILSRGQMLSILPLALGIVLLVWAIRRGRPPAGAKAPAGGSGLSFKESSPSKVSGSSSPSKVSGSSSPSKTPSGSSTPSKAPKAHKASSKKSKRPKRAGS
jgi:phosphatidylglycerol:prolipoprotein diacylglycerol transferase